MSAPVLRPIQNDAVSRVRLAFQKGSKAIVLQAATGYGKTLLASHIASGASARGNRVLFLAHQDILLRQMGNKLRDYEVPYGIIMAGYTPNPMRLIQIASVQTMINRIRKFKYEFELVIIDEAHRASAASYMTIIRELPNACVLGITGTPSRLDGKGLGKNSGGMFDTLITTESVGELIELGYLVRPVYYASKDKLDLSSVRLRAGDYDEGELAGMVDTPVITGSAVEHYKKHLNGQPALTWCINLQHARHTAEQFTAAGIPSIVLSGESSSQERESGLAALAQRRILNVCFAQLLVEGVDVPSIRGLIMLRPTKSLTAYLQVCGRGLRVDPEDASKDRCIILDHAGLAFTHGLCDEMREWALDGVPKKKKKKEASVSLEQCKQCYAIFVPAPVCPQCGALVVKVKREGPREVAGELKEITPDTARRLQAVRHKEVRGAQTLEQLRQIARDRGYQPGWADIQWRFKMQRQKQDAEENAAQLEMVEDSSHGW